MKSVILTCMQCNKSFKRFYSKIKKGRQFCSKNCRKINQKENPVTTEVTCLTCNKQFYKRNTEIIKNKKHFCSRSCSATYSNKNSPRRAVQGKCKTCGEPIRLALSYCTKHKFGPHKYEYNLDVTLGDTKGKGKYPSNKFTRVRDQSRRVAKSLGLLNKCAICGYSNIVMACHIKPVSEFSDDTLLSEINSPKNLIGLCPNHHWELDHGFLNKEMLLEGIEPPTRWV